MDFKISSPNTFNQRTILVSSQPLAFFFSKFQGSDLEFVLSQNRKNRKKNNVWDRKTLIEAIIGGKQSRSFTQTDQ